MTEKTTDTAKEADSAETTEQTIIDDTIITAGSLSRGLKKCREAADMDIKQAADEMRLPVHVLKALEAEEFADLPEPPYIRGYLRSYSRLNDSDPNELIRRYEVLRGANPDDITSFALGMPINRTANKNKSTVSPATVKLAGLALMVLVLGVLSMIPAVSQWVDETWRSFSDKTEQQQIATEENTEQSAPEKQNTEGSAVQDTDSGTGSSNNNRTASNNDTATSNNEQLTLNDQDNAITDTSDDEESNGSSDTDSTPVANASDANTAEESAENTSTDTSTAADSEQENITQETGTATQAENLAIMEAADRAAEEKKKAEEEAKALKLAEEKKAEEEAKALKLAEEKKAEEEAKALKLAEEKKAEEEAEALKLAAAEAAKKAQEKKDDFQQPIDGTVNIQLVFSESVWMSIKDQKGKNVFASLNGPGTRKQLKARTPLMFRVGNAPGVKIYLNGQLVDQKPYTQGSVSQFRIR